MAAPTATTLATILSHKRVLITPALLNTLTEWQWLARGGSVTKEWWVPGSMFQVPGSMFQVPGQLSSNCHSSAAASPSMSRQIRQPADVPTGRRRHDSLSYLDSSYRSGWVARDGNGVRARAAGRAGWSRWER